MVLLQKCRAVICGGFRFWTSNLDELVFRALMSVYAVSPVLFVSIETSPTVLTLLAALVGAINLATKGLHLARATIGLAVALAVLSGLVVLSLLWSVDTTRTLVAARDVFGYSVAAILLVQCILALPAAQYERLKQASFVGLLIGLFAMMARELYFAFISEQPRFVENVFTLHKITVYGAFFAVMFLARPGLIWKSLAAVFAVLTLLYGQSTGVDLAIIFIAVFFLTPAKYRQGVLVGFFAVYMLLALIAPLAAPPLFAFLDTKGWLAFHPGTFAARLELWSMISPHVVEAPILGHGANTMRNAVGVVVNPTYYVLDDLPSAHNIVFDIWYELGAIGIVAYALFVAAIIRTIGRLSGACHLIAGSCLIIAVVELSVDHRFWLSWVLGTLVFVASLCVLHCRPLTKSTRRDLAAAPVTTLPT